MNAKLISLPRITALLSMLALFSQLSICQKIDPEHIIANYIKENACERKGMLVSIEIRGTRNSTQKLPFTQLIDNKGNYSCETKVDHWAIIERYNNGTAYIQNPLDDNSLSQEISKGSLDYIQMFEASDLEGILINRKDKGITIRSCRQVTIAGKDLYLIELNIKNSSNINYYLGVDDFLTYRKDYILLGSNDTVIVELGDYKYIDGIPFSSKSKTTFHDEQISTIVIEDIRLMYK